MDTKCQVIFLVYKLPSGELADSDLWQVLLTSNILLPPARTRDLPSGLAGFKYYLEKTHPFDVWKAT